MIQIIESYAQSIHVEGDDPCRLLLESGKPDAALQCAQARLDAGERGPLLLHVFGLALHRLGRHGEAEGCLREAIAATPGDAAVLNTLGGVLTSLERYDEAIDTLRAVVAGQPGFAPGWVNLGIALMQKGSGQQAVSALMNAVRLCPDDVTGWCNLSLALRSIGEWRAAIEATDQALAREPESAVAHVLRGHALLMLGELREGFRENEWRLKPPLSSGLPVDRPVWDGVFAKGQTLLVIAEQGRGDNIQFVRYLPFLAEQGLRIVVVCPADLQSLFETVPGIASTQTPEESLPGFDFWIPLMSLPALARTSLDHVPQNLPYVMPPFGVDKKWHERLRELGDTIKVGLCWRGSGRLHRDGRSAELAHFLPLAGIPGVQYISLWNQPPDDREAAARLGLVDWSDELEDFLETAGLVVNLDLVISVDTAVLHLAGALDRPAWGLIGPGSDWRWMLEREDSPWYPRMKLFRQQPGETWTELAAQAGGLLARAMDEVLAGVEGE